MVEDYWDKMNQTSSVFMNWRVKCKTRILRITKELCCPLLLLEQSCLSSLSPSLICQLFKSSNKPDSTSLSQQSWGTSTAPALSPHSSSTRPPIAEHNDTWGSRGSTTYMIIDHTFNIAHHMCILNLNLNLSISDNQECLKGGISSISIEVLTFLLCAHCTIQKQFL